MIGTTLNHYQITASLGAGGMGEVYRATDTKLGRAVAIKVLPSGFSRDPQSLARFEREAQALAALNHPNIAGIHGFEADQGIHFLVLELVEGDTLAERLRRGALPMKEALTIARQMAEAIQEAHEKGVIHRDLKPGNVKLTPNGRVKVLDFGLAKMEQGVRGGSPPANDPDAPTLIAAVTLPGSVMGTPAYMSPEQARGQEVDKRTDIWAFGCCLFECLSGLRPFRGKTASDLMAEVLKGEPDWSVLPAETPREVVSLLRRCLEKDPTRRLSSFGDIALMLDEATHGPPAATSSPDEQPGPPLGASRSPASPAVKRLWPAVVVLLFLFVGAGAFWWTRYGAKSAPQPGSATTPASDTNKSIAVLPFVNMSGNSDNEYFSDGITEEILNALARTRGLRVAARTSAFYFKGKNEPVQKIGAALNVGVVLEGSVRRVADQLRITAQLINVTDGFHLWSATYDRRVEDIFAIQSEVAQRVLEALKVQLLADSSPAGPGGGTDNLKAYDLFLRGREHWNRRTGADLERAIGYFQQATEKDPNFALAHAGLAACHGVLPWYTDAAILEAIAKARSAANRALELAPEMAEAHAVLAYCFAWEGDTARSEDAYRRALACNPNYATAHQWFAELLADSGRPQLALAEIRVAAGLDPLSATIQAGVGRMLLDNRRHDEALAQLDRTLQLAPDFPLALRVRGLVLLNQKRFPEAITDLERALELNGNYPTLAVLLGHCYAATGRTNQAQQQLGYLQARFAKGLPTGSGIAFIHHGFGDREQVFAWLERAAQNPFERVQILRYYLAWESVTADPRFDALLKKHGLDK